MSTVASGGHATSKGLFGEKPDVPQAPDYLAELKKTIEGDTALMPDLATLSSSATALYRQIMEQAHPGSIALETAAQKDIAGLLKGELPGMDDYIKRRGAETAADTGTGGSFALGQELNIGFQQRSRLIGEGLSAADRWAQNAQRNTFDFSKMFFGPGEAIQQADAKWNRDWLAAQVKAAPDPQMRGAMDVEAAFGMAVMGFFSGGGGKGNIPQGSSQANANYGGGGGGYMGNMSGGSDFQSYFGDNSYQPPQTQGFDQPTGDFSAMA